MARVTIEDCLDRVPTRFGLVHLAAKRVRQIYRGAPVLVRGDNKEIVMAMRKSPPARSSLPNLCRASSTNPRLTNFWSSQ